MPEHERTEPARGDAPEVVAGVAPGALSALLEELARGPTPGSGADARPWPLPGVVIGRFELVREVGRGGFGVVYEARDRELQRAVAFKLVRPGRLRIGEDQFRREADVIARFSHPNLVTLFDVGRSEHGPYLVLELLRGETLQAQLEQGPMPVEEAVRVAAEVAKGLAHAHAQGVVHRDLKPSNVFLCGDGRVKLLDFGMAHAFGWRGLDGGTPAYMAPEQWRGAPEDERTDVYALGVVLYRMLAGELPFRIEEDGGEVRSSRRAPALEIPGEPALAVLIAKMLENDPTRRPREASEVLAALEPLQRAIDARGAPVGPVRKVRGAGRRMAALIATGAILGLAGGAAVKLISERGASSPRARAIAVLPFDNMNGGAGDEYFSDGLAEEILNLLTRVRELKVAASASTFRFKNRKVDPAEVGERLRVDVVLVGSVRREEGRVRIGAELVDARSGFRVWSQIYDRQLADVFAIQDDIARQVVSSLELVLSRASESELGKRPTVNLAAYDLYLRGRDYLRRPVTKENLEQATKLFDEAIAGDAGFAQAYAGLCEAWLARYEMTRATASFERGERACRAALDRDRKAGEVYVALGNLHLLSGRPEDAGREFRAALDLGRSRVDALLGLAAAQAGQHQPQEAEKTYELAKRVDPGDFRPHQQLGNFLFARGRYREAARSYAEVVARTPDNASALSNLGGAHYMAGELELAVEAWQTALRLSPTGVICSNIGTSYFFLGRFEDAAGMFTKAVDLAPEDYRLWGNLGDAYTHASGRAADATAAYRKAVALAEKGLRIDSTDAHALSDLAHYRARLGDLAIARRLIADAVKRDPDNNYVRYNAALVEVRLGEPEAALDHLERAVALGWQRDLLPRDAGLAPLRGQPRFTALLAPPRDR